MSWGSNDAMKEVVEACLKGWSCKNIAIRWLEREEQHPWCSRRESDEIKVKLDALQEEGVIKR